MDKKQITIAITGAKGFIATHLIKALEEKYRGDESVYINLILLDTITNFDVTRDKIKGDVDIIYHLAAQTDVQTSRHDPVEDATVNIAGTLKILLDNPEAKIILPASAAAIKPQSPYGVSKLAQELYTRVLREDNAVIVRLPNVYGEGGKGVVDIFKTTPQIRVNGDGLQKRDFLHVTDVADALVKAMEWLPNTYELSSGTCYTIKEIAEATGKPITYREALEGEVFESQLSNTTPNWAPTRDVIDYIKN